MPAGDSNRTVRDIAQVRSVGGVAVCQDMITTQQALLSSERRATLLLGQRQLASVFQIKALVGG